jgi:hypothetical protein
MTTGHHAYHPQFAGTFDDDSTQWQGLAAYFDLARAESMDLSNDPRFFSGNVIDKRLEAFGKLTLISGLMLGTSMGQCFSLKKDMNLAFQLPPIGFIQLLGFGLQMLCTFLCIISLYTIAHQLFYTYRLMTSGPTGFEAASMFYLNKTMTMWRHFAIKCLLNGLWVFILSSGVQLFSKFYKDAEATHDIDKPALDMKVHFVIGFIVFLCYGGVTLFLCMLRRHHLSAFRQYYQVIKAKSQPITDTMRDMQHRAGLVLDT